MKSIILKNDANSEICDEINFNTTQRSYIEYILNDDLTINMKNDFKEFALYGGYRAGKSFIQQLVLFLICCKYENIRVIYVRNTYPELKDTVIPQFRQAFEKYEKFNYVESSKDGSHIAKFDTGSEIRFRSADEPTKLLSAEYDVICLCQGETIPREVVQLLIGRWSGTRLPKKLFLNEGNPAGTWVKTEYYDRTKEQLAEDNILFLQVETKENLQNIDSNFIEDYRKRNSDIDYRRYILGEFVGSEDMVFTEFTPDNIIDPVDMQMIAPNYKKGIGGDYGQRNLATFIWGYKDYDGRIIIYDSWGATKQTAQQIATAGLKYGKQPCVYDFSCKEKDRYGISEWDRIQKAGLPLIECSKQDEAGTISYINGLFKQGLLLIAGNNPDLIWELNNWKYPPKRLGSDINLKEIPIDANNHYIDAMKYFIKWVENLKSVSDLEKAEQNSFARLVRSKPKRSPLSYG